MNEAFKIMHSWLIMTTFLKVVQEDYFGKPFQPCMQKPIPGHA